MPPPPHRILERIRTNSIQRHAHQATKTRGFATYLVREGAAFPFFVLFSPSHFSRSLTLPTIFPSKKRERGPIAQKCRTHCYLKSHTNPTTRTGAVCALPCPHQRQGARAKSAKRRVLVQRQRDAVVVEHVVPLCSTGFCVSVLLAKQVKSVATLLAACSRRRCS